MTDLNLRELYSGLLSRFDFDRVSSELLLKIAAGSDKADDYEEILKKDKFFTATICRLASENMKHQVVNSLSHGVVVVGQDHARDLVLGQSLERFFDPYADNSFKGADEVEKNLKYSVRAEEHAAKCKNDYAGLAFAAGFLFDFFAMWISKQKVHQDLLREFLEFTWKHSLKTASLAWALSNHERVFIGHRKIIFASGILHEIGALGLALYNPNEYVKVIEKYRAQQEFNASDDGYQMAIEREFFDLSHCEIGSAIVFQTKMLRDLESEVDFHHDSIVLKTRNPDAFLGTAIVHIADRTAWLMDRKPNFTMEDLQEILKPHAAYFPLKSPDVMRLATEVRSKGLLNG